MTKKTDRPRDLANDLIGIVREGTKKWTKTAKAEERNPVSRSYRAQRMTHERGVSFKEAAARLMQREFGVALDPVTEVNHCIGSKTALSMLPACFINPGDVTLMTVPGYPVAGTHTA